MHSDPSASRSSATPVPTVTSVNVGELTGDWDFLADLARRRNVAGLFRSPSPRLGNDDALFSYDAASGSLRFNSPEGRFEPRPSLGRKTVRVGVADSPEGRQVFVGIFTEMHNQNGCPASGADGHLVLPTITFEVLLDAARRPIAVGAPSLCGMGPVSLSAEQIAELSPLVERGLQRCTAQIAELPGADTTPDLPSPKGRGDISAF
jgi:hypothetical protein